VRTDTAHTQNAQKYYCTYNALDVCHTRELNNNKDGILNTETCLSWKEPM